MLQFIEICLFTHKTKCQPYLESDALLIVSIFDVFASLKEAKNYVKTQLSFRKLNFSYYENERPFL